VPVNGWRLDLQPGSDYPTGASVDISDAMWPGRPIKIVYAVEPAQLSPGDDFTVSGLPETAADLVCLGAAARLVVSADLARTQTFTVEHAQFDANPGTGAAASRYLTQQYMLRLKAERDRLYGRYPIRTRRTW
jgi:hypothetical protein